MLNPSVVAGAPACDSEQASPAEEAGDARKALDFAHGPDEMACTGDGSTGIAEGADQGKSLDRKHGDHSTKVVTFSFSLKLSCSS